MPTQPSHSSPGESAPPGVRPNADQQLYVIPQRGGVICLGFNNARDHANLIAQRLSRHDLAFHDDDFGTIAGYDKFRRAQQAWGESRLSNQTYFEPGTEAAVARVLERCRRSGCKVRLILGDLDTGQSWFDEYSVVGQVSRSSGWVKIPLLLEDGEDWGGSILTASVLCIIDWLAGKTLYRHHAYREPQLNLVQAAQPSSGWAVQHLGKELACFKDIGKAAAYLAFMCGETIEPRILR